MEVKINREIRNYTESIFFGLSLRQFIFSVLACISAVFLYFSFKGKLSIEILSWLCIFGAVPFVLLGFITYNGMTVEKFIYAWLRSELLIPRHLKFKTEDIYYLSMKNHLDKKRKEE